MIEWVKAEIEYVFLLRLFLPSWKHSAVILLFFSTFERKTSYWQSFTGSSLFGIVPGKGADFLDLLQSVNPVIGQE